MLKQTLKTYDLITVTNNFLSLFAKQEMWEYKIILQNKLAFSQQAINLKSLLFKVNESKYWQTKR